MNVSTLRSVLPTKFATSSSSLPLHRSLGQKQDKFQAYKSNLEMNLDALSTNNPFLTIMICDFNAKSTNWYLIDITSFEGSKIEPIASNLLCSR